MERRNCRLRRRPRVWIPPWFTNPERKRGDNRILAGGHCHYKGIGVRLRKPRRQAVLHHRGHREHGENAEKRDGSPDANLRVAIFPILCTSSVFSVHSVVKNGLNIMRSLT